MIVLAIGAHPDDELYAGGLLAKYAEEGHDVYILLSTRGEGGPMGDPPIGGRAELAEFRGREAQAAARALGARDVLFLPFQDPVRNTDGTLYPINATREEFSAAIADVLGSLRPDAVITHGSGGEYGHPQHLFTHAAVFAALQALRPWHPREVLTWEAAYPEAGTDRKVNPDDPADIVIDVTPWLSKKLAGYRAHRTQYPAFFSAARGETLEHVVERDRIESYHRWPQEEHSNGIM